MFDVLKKSFALKVTYRINSIIYSLKQIPLVKKLLPDTLYKVSGLKTFAKVLMILWGIIFTFLGKLIYLSVMVYTPISHYEGVAQGDLFIHILLFLTIIGALLNTNVFNPSKYTYYGVILMRMDARSHTLSNYYSYLLRTIIGFLPFVLILGSQNQVPIRVCLLFLPFITGLKLTVAAIYLLDYEKNERTTDENKPRLAIWCAVALLLFLAYGLPAFGFVLPVNISIAFMVLSSVSGILAFFKVQNFKSYHDMYKQLFAKSLNQMDTPKEIAAKATKKAISNNTQITSDKKGFEYLNDLFIKRHRKILWRTSKITGVICAILLLVLLILSFFITAVKETVNKMLMLYLPFFVFVMYSINRGVKFTNALFINCDNSLFTYSIYKQPKYILTLFIIRLREIVKINLFPASIIATGLPILLFASGGTDNAVNYVVLFVSIISLSILFSVHYLTLYYLLQPYNAETEMKSATYTIASIATYFVCYFIMRLEMSTLVFGIMTIVFCVSYSIIACILVYKLSPKTFRLRN